MPNWKILVDKGNGAELVTLAELKHAMDPLKPTASKSEPEQEPGAE